jgi:hypothetical protein
VFQTATDTEAPSIEVSPEQEAPMGSDATVYADVNDNTGLERVILHYRKGGDSNFSTIDMNEASSSSGYEADIPGAAVTEKGVEYYISAIDLGGNEGITEHFMYAITIPAKTCQPILYTGGFEQSDYRMISIPLQLKNPAADHVLSALGEYSKESWRLFHDDGNTYREYPDAGDFVPGKAFWLIARKSAVLEIPEGAFNHMENYCTINLKPGWNQIGLPLNFDIAWSDILLKSNASSEDIDGPFLYKGEYSIPSSLSPFEGYYVYNGSDGNRELHIPFNGVGASLEKKNEIVPQWQATIRANVENARDNLNVIGASKQALDGYDVLDHREPPPIGSFISVYFPHPEWEKNPGNYAVDIRSA